MIKSMKVTTACYVTATNQLWTLVVLVLGNCPFLHHVPKTSNLSKFFYILLVNSNTVSAC